MSVRPLPAHEIPSEGQRGHPIATAQTQGCRSGEHEQRCGVRDVDRENADSSTGVESPERDCSNPDLLSSQEKGDQKPAEDKENVHAELAVEDVTRRRHPRLWKIN